jgi:hypothetical protein
MATARQAGGATTTRNVIAFLVALSLLLSLLVAVSACGDEDLVLPGMVRFTPTPADEPTDTPDPDEDDT